MRVKVTTADIETGKSHGYGPCPVSLALERDTGKKWYVGEKQAYLASSLGKLTRKINLPLKAYFFIVLFDFLSYFKQQRLLKPFSFEFKMPAEELLT